MLGRAWGSDEEIELRWLSFLYTSEPAYGIEITDVCTMLLPDPQGSHPSRSEVLRRRLIPTPGVHVMESVVNWNGKKMWKRSGEKFNGVSGRWDDFPLQH